MGRKGFGSMDPAKQRAIAAMGGRAAHAAGSAHEFKGDEARAAGQLGGDAVVAQRGRDYMVALGKAGGLARSASLLRQKESAAMAQDLAVERERVNQRVNQALAALRRKSSGAES